MNNMILWICLISFFLMIFLPICAFTKAPYRVTEDMVIYDRFQVKTIIHKRLIVAEDIQTKQLYWMIRDCEWLISAPYSDGKD